MSTTACRTILWDGQKLHKNRIVRVHIKLWRLSFPLQKEYLKKIGTISFIIPTKPSQKINTKKIKLRARLLVRPWPDQLDRLLRPCPGCLWIGGCSALVVSGWFWSCLCLETLLSLELVVQWLSSMCVHFWKQAPNVAYW